MEDERQHALVWDDVPIQEDWIDFNGHLNMAYYLVVFDRAVDRLMRHVGLSDQADDGDTLFAVEASLRYLAEVKLDDRVACVTRVLFVDDKRMLTWQELRHADGRVAATCENVHLHVDRKEAEARVWRFSDEVRTALSALVDRDTPPPEHSRMSGLGWIAP